MLHSTRTQNDFYLNGLFFVKGASLFDFLFAGSFFGVSVFVGFPARRFALLFSVSKFLAPLVHEIDGFELVNSVVDAEVLARAQGHQTNRITVRRFANLAHKLRQLKETRERKLGGGDASTVLFTTEEQVPVGTKTRPSDFSPRWDRRIFRWGESRPSKSPVNCRSILNRFG